MYKTAAAHDSDAATDDGAQTHHHYHFFPPAAQHGAQPSATGPPKQADQQTRGMGRATNAAAMPPAAPVSGASVAITRRAQFLQLHTSLRPNRARLDASLLSAEQTQREAQHILQRVEAAGIDPRMRPGTLLARTTPQVIFAYGGQKRSRHEEHQATFHTPQWERREDRQPEPLPASDPECIREATRRAREGAVAACGLGAALAATAEGKIVTDSDQEAELRVRACCDLIDQLPPRSLAFVCGRPEKDLQYISATRVVAHFLQYTKKWKAGQIYQARLAWSKFLMHLHMLDDSEEDPNGQISLMVLTEYGAAYHSRSTAKCGARALQGPFNPGEKLPQTGSTAADGQMKHLGFLARNFGLLLEYKLVPKFGTDTNVVRNPPQPARPFSLKMIIAMEEFALRSDITNPMANIACAILFCVFGGHRVRQSQQQDWLYVHNDILFGRTNDKSGAARRTFTSLIGIRFGSRWFARLQETLIGVEAGGFIFRQFFSPNSRPDHPQAKMLNAPLDPDSITRCMRIVVQAACPFITGHEVDTFSMHSARHVLQEIGKGRQEGVDARVELGCWAHITAAKDRYALESRVNRVCNIMHRQWRSVQTWLQKTCNGDVGAAPRFGGWDDLPKFNPATEEA